MRTFLLLAGSAAPPAPRAAPGISCQQIVYGKYYAKDAESGGKVLTDQTCASRALPGPRRRLHRRQSRRGGQRRRAHRAVVSNGTHFMSMGYRLVATKYYYGAAGLEEEFIHASANGTLTLDEGGKVLSSYAVRRGRTKFNTKCSYDAAQALEHLLSNAKGYGVDPLVSPPRVARRAAAKSTT